MGWLTMVEREYGDDYTDPRPAVFYDQLDPCGPDGDFVTLAEELHFWPGGRP